MKAKNLYLIHFFVLVFLATGCEKEGETPTPPHFAKPRNAYLENGSFLKELHADSNEQWIKFQIREDDKKYLIFNCDIITETQDPEGKPISKKRYQSYDHRIDWKEFRFEWGYIFNNGNGDYTIQIRENHSDDCRIIKFYLRIVDTASVSDSGKVDYTVEDFCDFTITQSPKNQNNMVVKIRYNGTEYSSRATVSSDGTMTYDNEDFLNLIISLGEKDTESFVMSDGILQVYDAELPEAQKIRKVIVRSHEASPILRSVVFGTSINSGNPYDHLDSNALGYFIASDDYGFRGRYVACNLTRDFYECYDVHKTGDMNFNDNISSLFVYTPATVTNASAVLTIWEDPDYNYGDVNRRKHKMSIVANPSSPVSLPNLSILPLIGTSSNWNNRISSLSFHFTDGIYPYVNY